MKLNFKNRPFVHLEDKGLSCVSADTVDYFNFRRRFSSMTTRRTLMVQWVYCFST